MKRELFLLLTLFLISSCATMIQQVAEVQVRAAWMDQPAGARGAFIRCIHEVAEHQCGDSNINDPSVRSCMEVQVGEYRKFYSKQIWLMEHGCSEERARLNPNEI